MSEKRRCSFSTDAVRHETTGLLLMPRTSHGARCLTVSHTVDIPHACCPRSRNPLTGSTITLTYDAETQSIEVYSLQALLKKFIGGWAGNSAYPAERNMEGMVELVARMAADALGVTVFFSSKILLDCGEMEVSGEAVPS